MRHGGEEDESYISKTTKTNIQELDDQTNRDHYLIHNDSIIYKENNELELEKKLLELSIRLRKEQILSKQNEEKLRRDK
jgi:hypothetical protein